MKCDCKEYAPSVLRLALGLVFIIPGLQKLANPAMIAAMLQGMGFPAPTLLGWLVLLAEIIFGVAVLVGWKVKKTVWPLVVILAVALISVHIPAWMAAKPMALIGVLFHLLGIAALVSLYLSGPGAKSINKN